MARSFRFVGAALAVLGVFSPSVSAQTEPPRTFAKDTKGCQFLNAFPGSETQGQYEWSGECKDGFVSGMGSLTYLRTNVSWTGDFVAGELKRGSMRMKDGSVYEGDFKDNHWHGRGTLRLADGSLLTCAFTSGRSGPGPVIIEGKDGSRYEGEFDHTNDVIEGRGKIIFPNGLSYEGMWRKGTFEGEGVLEFANGDVRSGTFVKGVFNGTGTISYANGDKYQGQVQSGLPNGKGRLASADGDTYEGEFVAGEYQGAGVLRYANGSTLEGEFRAGEVYGRGKLVFWNGDVYEGELLASLRHGLGKLVRAAGGFEEGQWQSGQLQGECTIKTKNVLYRGECVGGQRWGRGHLEDSRTNQVYDGEFRDNVVHGKGVLQGKDYRYEGEFASGEKEGQGKETAKGSEYEGSFAAGKYNGQGRLKMSRDDGDALYEGSFAGGEFNGTGTYSFRGVRLEGEFVAGGFVRGTIEGGNRKFEIDFAQQSFLEILPDGSKRSIQSAELSEFGVRS